MLETTFYWMAIVYMSIMFILLIALVSAVFVIKHKIDLIHRQIDEKLRAVTSVMHVGEEIVDKVKHAVGR